MSQATVRQAARRIADHAEQHRLPEVDICLHGGEPLLAAQREVELTLAQVQAALSPVTRPRFSVQTNGVLLDQSWLDLFAHYGVAVSISVDGNQEAHDRHRRSRLGRPSHAAVVDAVHLLSTPAYRNLYAGLLAVVDVDTDPAAFLDGLFQHDPPQADLLLPHTTWASPPPPTGKWLTAAFDHWYAQRPPRPLRTFESLVGLLLGSESGCELLGLNPLGYAIIDTDGAYRQTEALNAAYDGAAATGLTVFDASVDTLLEHPGFAARQTGRAGLAAQCRSCDLVRVCGGGHYAHRYRPGSGFDNPSVYCDDLQMLITHAGRRVEADVRRAAAAGAGCEARP